MTVGTDGGRRGGLLVVSALAGELEPALGDLGRRGAALALEGPGRLWRFERAPGRAPVVAGWTGMGRAATERGLAASFAAGPAGALPEAVLHVGVAGALQRGLAPGDLVVCSEVVGPAGEDGDVPRPEAPPRLAAWVDGLVGRGVHAAGGRVVRGRTVTVDGVVSSPAAKAALAAASGADVAEMECRWAVHAAAAAGVPILCVRAVVDALGQPLPDLSAGLDAVGRPRPLSLLGRLARRPGDVRHLPALARAFGAAQRALREAVRGALAGWEA